MKAGRTDFNPPSIRTADEAKAAAVWRGAAWVRDGTAIRLVELEIPWSVVDLYAVKRHEPDLRPIMAGKLLDVFGDEKV